MQGDDDQIVLFTDSAAPVEDLSDEERDLQVLGFRGHFKLEKVRNDQNQQTKCQQIAK